mgnify:FL=1
MILFASGFILVSHNYIFIIINIFLKKNMASMIVLIQIHFNNSNIYIFFEYKKNNIKINIHFLTYTLEISN